MDRRLLLALAGVALAAPAVARASSNNDEKKKAGGESYLPLDTLLGTTIRPDGRRGVLSVDCGLDVPDKALRARAEASIPRLRAAFFQMVQGYASSLSMGAVPNVDYIGASLQRQADIILGRPGARVLLGAIVVN